MPKKNDGGPAPVEQVYIEYWPLSKFISAPRNPKLHDVEEIAQSIRRFGFVSPGVVNEVTGRAVVGHGRAEGLALYKERHDKGEEGWTTMPRRIVEKDGEWWFPVERGVSFDSDAEAEAYLLADNRLTLSGGLDNQILAETLKDLSVVGFGGTGYTADDLTALNSIWGRTELVQFTAFTDPQPPVMKFRVVIPNLTETGAKKVAKGFPNAFIEQYREK